MTDDAKTRASDDELIRSLWQEARDLIKRLEGSTVQRLAVRAGEYEIEIERGASTVAPAAAGVSPLIGGAVAGVPVAGEAAAQPAAEVDGRHPIVAPLVGTFYRASQPGAKPFVEEGDVVDKGQTLCIVEAMKIMNQVQADQPGRVSEILLQDGDWVEFQQVLMYLEPIGA
jgi:acetyl-CoA carboxylase biotin carboxyl carrier protein